MKLLPTLLLFLGIGAAHAGEPKPVPHMQILPLPEGQASFQRDGQEIARYDLSGAGQHNAQIMAKVSRDGDGWSMTAIGATASGRTFQHLLPAVSAHL